MSFLSDLDNSHKYFRSYENIAICKPFIVECQRLDNIGKEYAPRFTSLFEEIKCNIVRKEYGTGGEVSRRGFYCPSPVQDIVIGNNSRGRLLKREPTARSKVTYEYGFNVKDELIFVQKNDVDDELKNNGIIDYKLIFRNNNVEIGVSFGSFNDVELVSEYMYHNDGLIHSYRYCFMGPGIGPIGYWREDYEYSIEGLKTMDLYDFYYSETRPMLQHQKYHFEHDEDGYLSRYYVTEYEANNEAKPEADIAWYDVRIKRKV